MLDYAEVSGDFNSPPKPILKQLAAFSLSRLLNFVPECARNGIYEAQIFRGCVPSSSPSSGRPNIKSCFASRVYT